MARRYWNINLEEMLEAGVHFGHGTRKWNPTMAPYISAKRKGIHITNLTRTSRFLSETYDLVFDAARLGGMLTNWPTIEMRLHKFRDLRTEQKTGGLNQQKLIKISDEYIKAQLTWKQSSSEAQAFQDVKAPNRQHKEDLWCCVTPRKRCCTTHVDVLP
ncbi:hypothetical protein Godav_023277, partial [Gossypium davidsonii]|nr:hypothetical protein [Gossypium davidsonii]